MIHLFDGRIKRAAPGYLVPRGTIIAHMSIGNFPPGWLPCWGQSVSRVKYSKLFELLGTAFGGCVESDYFNLPDLRGRTMIGCGNGSSLSARNVGQTGGTETQTLSTDNMPAHAHTGTTSTNGSHTHSHNATGSPYSLSTYTGSNTATGDLDTSSSEADLYAGSVALTINSAGDHTHTFTTSTEGSGEAFNIMQPFVVMNYLIRI
jgi:microcystin-dependent protein